MIKSFFNQKEDKEKKMKTKNLIDQLIEHQKLTMKVLKAITERISK